MPKAKLQPKSIQPTPAVQAKLRVLFAQLQSAQNNLNIYAEGVAAGLGLDPIADWGLQADTMTFVRQEKKETEAKEANSKE